MIFTHLVVILSSECVCVCLTCLCAFHQKRVNTLFSWYPNTFLRYLQVGTFSREKKKLKEKVSVVCSVSGKVVDFLVPLYTLKALVNSKLEKVKEWSDVSKLSMNTAKTKFMIIKSSKKKDMSVNIQIRNKDETYHPRVRKDHIK